MIIRNREVDQLTIDELLEPYALLRMVDANASVVRVQPLLSRVRLRLIERQIDCFIVSASALQRLEPDRVAFDLTEVLFCFGGRGRAQALVILDLATLKASIATLLDPVFIVGDREEGLRGARPMAHFDDRRDEFLEEPWHLEQAWPEVMDKINEEALNVGAIVVLISHDHDRAIAKLFHIRVRLAHVEPHNLDQVL